MRLFPGSSVQVDLELTKTPNSTRAIDSIKPVQSATKGDKIVTSDNENEIKIWKRFIGILLTLLSALCFSLVLVVTKFLPHLHPITQTVWRQLVNTIISTIIMLGVTFIPWIKNASIWKGIIDINQIIVEGSSTTTTPCVKIHWNMFGKILSVGVITGIGMLSKVTSLNYLSIADATVLAYLSLVFVIILSSLVLHEKCLIVQSIVAGIIILGAFIISRPPFLTGASGFDTSTLIGFGIKTIDCITTALFFIGVRYLRSLHFAPLMIILSTTGFVIALSISFALNLFKLPDNLNDILLLSSLGALTATSHISKILALKFERATTVSLLRCADVPFAFIWQILIFQIQPDIWTWIGTLLVGIAVLITCLTKLVSELPKESPRKEQFGFLLKSF